MGSFPESHVSDYDFNLKQNRNENIQWTNSSFYIPDICAPVHSQTRLNTTVSHEQRNLSILLPVLALT